MKKLFTFLLLLCIGTFVSVSVSAQSNWGLKKNISDNPELDKLVKHLGPENILAAGFPQKTWGYSWNTDWELQTYMETSYFPNGNVHVEMDYDIITNLPTARWTYSYDGQGRLTEMLGESNETGSWENAMKYTIAYDSHGNLSEMVASMWTGDAWFIIFGSQQTYGYTPQNYVSSITYRTYDFFSGWVWDTKDIYTLDGSGYPTQVLTQVYNGAWADSSRYVDIDWYEYIPQAGWGSFEYYVEELWDGAAWITNFRELTDYDGTGGYVMTNQNYAGGWVNSFRETMTVQNNRPTLYKYEDWVEGAWVQSSGEKYLYTFSGDNLTEEIIQTYDPGIPGYVNWAKYVYGDFFYTTGIIEAFSESSFRVYPNPVGEEMTIQVNSEVTSGWYFEVLSLTGQVVAAKSADLGISKMVSIPVGSLPKGMYIIRATVGDRLITSKFLKE